MKEKLPPVLSPTEERVIQWLLAHRALWEGRLERRAQHRMDDMMFDRMVEEGVISKRTRRNAVNVSTLIKIAGTTVMLIIALFLSGCAVYNVNTGSPPCARPVPHTSQYTLVNNTGHALHVYQDGQFILTLAIGAVLPVRGTLLWRNTTVTVTGYDTLGNYIGTDSWIFEFGHPEVWTASRLYKPIHYNGLYESAE